MVEAPPLRGVKWGEVDGSAAGARGLRQTPRSLPAAPAWALPLHQPIPPPPPQSNSVCRAKRATCV